MVTDSELKLLLFVKLAGFTLLWGFVYLHYEMEKPEFPSFKGNRLRVFIKPLCETGSRSNDYLDSGTFFVILHLYTTQMGLV